MAERVGWLKAAEREDEERARRERLAAQEEARRAERDRWRAEVHEREAAERKFVDSIVGADATVKRTRQAVAKGEKELVQARAELASAEERLAELASNVPGADLSGANLGDLAAVVRAQKDAALAQVAEQRALETVSAELTRRLQKAERAQWEAEEAALRAERMALHAFCDQLIVEARETIAATADAFEGIRRCEDAIRERGGVRQAFSTDRVVTLLIDLRDRWEVELAEIEQFSEAH